MNHLFKLQEGSYNALRMFQTILKSIFDLASVGSVTVSCASHSIHVPAIWIASGMEPEKRGYFQFQICSPLISFHTEDSSAQSLS